MKNVNPYRWITRGSMLAAVALLAGCASYAVKPTPQLNAMNTSGHVKSGKLFAAAKAYTTNASTKEILSENMVSHGIIPVQVSFSNAGKQIVVISRSDITLSTHGEDLQSISSADIYKRFRHSQVAAAFEGGIFSMSAADHANHKMERAFASKELPKNIVVASGESATGYLYFHAKPADILGSKLKLSYSTDGKTVSMAIPLL